MNRLFRSLLFWLVMLALPLQGFAQVGMIACHTGNAGQHTQAAASEGHADRHNQHTPDAAQTANDAQSACCACGPSCAVVSIHSSVSIPVLVQHDVFIEPSTEPPMVSAVSRRIDRPPKSSLT